MLKRLIDYVSKKPEIYEASTSKFWNDEHISKGMLDAHLNPEWDAATRKHTFVAKSAEWIASIASPIQYPELLDLGCGPGLYAERFCQCGYHVTGMDFSFRSIEYAIDSAKKNDMSIQYVQQDYLDMKYQEEYNVITLIYCDFSVLSNHNRSRLLDNIYQALKPGGIFILDVFTPNQYKDRKESRDCYYSQGGFWSEKANLCLNSFYRYDDSNTMLDQTIVITEDSIQCYNIWDHVFTKDELEYDLLKAGFTTVDFYGDVAGDGYRPDGNIMCAVGKKKGGR